jgi:hypothetical protein
MFAGSVLEGDELIWCDSQHRETVHLKRAQPGGNDEARCSWEMGQESEQREQHVVRPVVVVPVEGAGAEQRHVVTAHVASDVERMGKAPLDQQLC